MNTNENISNVCQPAVDAGDEIISITVEQCFEHLVTIHESVASCMLHK